MDSSIPDNRCGYEFTWGNDVIASPARVITRSREVVGVEFEGNSVNNQSCYRKVPKGEHFCVWHSPEMKVEAEDIESERESTSGTIPEATLNSQVEVDMSGFKLPYVDIREELCDVNLEEAILVYANFTDSTLNGVNFTKAQLQDSLFLNTEIDVDRNWRDKTCFKKAILRGTDFSEATFNEPIFREAVFDSNTSFSNDQSISSGDFRRCNLNNVSLKGIIARSCIFDESNISDCDFTSAKLENASFQDVNGLGAKFNNANMENANLAKSNLKGADFSGAELDSVDLSGVNINYNTTFGGKSIYETKPESANSFGKDNKRNLKAIWVYRTLERLHRENALTEIASNYYIWEKDLRRRQHRKEIFREAQKNTLNECVDDECLIRYRFRIFRRYVKSEASRFSIRYGESPLQLVLFSAAVILGFAAIYPIFGVSMGTTTIKYAILTDNSADLDAQIPLVLDLLRFSFNTFMRTEVQSMEPLGIGKIFAGIESTANAIAIALLVFVLTRRATS